MARLRRVVVEVDAVASSDRPAWLDRCTVEDWCSPGELRGAHVDEYMAVARRLWRDARLAWCDEHDLDVRTMTSVGSMPTFADRAAFIAAISGGR